MSIRFIKFRGPITVPARSSVVTLYNAEQDEQIRAEECPVGFALHVGKLDDKKQWQPTGQVVRVPWHMVEYVTETKQGGGSGGAGTLSVKEQKK